MNSTLKLSPNARTLRRAREQVKVLVADQVSPAKISHYLSRWATWWAYTISGWDTQELLDKFIKTCWDVDAQNIAKQLLAVPTTSLQSVSTDVTQV